MPLWPLRNAANSASTEGTVLSRTVRTMPVKIESRLGSFASSMLVTMSEPMPAAFFIGSGTTSRTDPAGII